MYVNRAGVSEIIEAPDLIKKLVAGEHSVVIGSEEIEKLELLGGNVNGSALELKLVLLEAYLNVFKSDNLLVNGTYVLVATAKNGLYSCGKLSDVKGLYNIIVSAELKSEHLVKDVALGAYHYNGAVGNLADLAANLPAVLAGDHNIEKNDIGLVELERADALAAIKYRFNLIALTLEMRL